MSIKKNIEEIKSKLGENTKLIAVSKTKTNEEIMEALNAGQVLFGENKAQELRDKAEVLPREIEWHFIGHLQRNKVKYVVPHASLIHSVDSLRLLKEINKQAIRFERVIPCLLQIDIAKEEAKFGFELEEIIEMLESDDFKKLKNISIHGVMGMGSITDDEAKTDSEFKELRESFDILKEKHFADKPEFKEVSMGMSGDYEIALRHGSTMVRIGSSVFGERNY